MGSSHHRNWPSMLQILLFIYSCFLGFAAASDTIRFNEPVGDSETLVSDGQKFKLGFFSPINSSYRYVGIMYNFPTRTVIWVANRDKPLNDSSGTLEISGDGNLVIIDGQKEIVWSTNLSSHVANSSAQLLDTGNLVLRDNSNSRTIWESFHHASDSFVEKMKISTDLSTNEKNILTSWRSPSDPAIGNYSLTLEPVEIPQSFIWKNGYPYWRSGPWNGQIFIGIPYMNSYYKGGLEIVSDNSESAYSMSFTLLNSSEISYFVLNASGFFEEKLWSHEKGDWVVTAWFIENECDIYGKCGPFGSCNAKDKPICKCFRGFEPKSKNEWDKGNWSNGCTRKTPLQCERNNYVGERGKQDGFVTMKGVKVPDNVKWFPNSEEECRKRCLNNCSCVAYAYYAGIGCMQWDESLIDVQKFSNGGADLYLRLANSELGGKKDWKAIIATTLALVFIALPVCVYFLWKLLVMYRGRKRKNELILSTTEKTEAMSEEAMLRYNGHGVKLEEFPLFKFQMLSDATNKFDSVNKLGQGGFGSVYKGKLPDGQEIAVKRLAKSSNQGLEEFMTEVEVISKLQHRNLVRLLGCCVESEEKMLVYEYLLNRSLDAYLFGSCKKKFLDWQAREVIIEGICRGLLYLHRDSRLRIIHRDLKASNILLDEELNPKISDFGLARIFGGKEDQANTTRVVGTYGYMAPEYASHGIFSEKSDVFSFGVLLLEILSGRRNSSFYDQDEQFFLIAYVWKLWNEEKTSNLMDPVIFDPQLESDIVRYANVALLCVQEVAADRPNISTVLSMLSCEIVDLPRPKQPAFVIIRRSSETVSSNKTPSKCSVNDLTVTVVEGR